MNKNSKINKYVTKRERRKKNKKQNACSVKFKLATFDISMTLLKLY